MRPKFKHFLHDKSVRWLIAVVAVCVTLLTITQQRLVSPVQVVAVEAQGSQLEAELITLTPSGFEPSKVLRSTGPFLLAINNQTGLEDLSLRLERQNGAQEQEVRFQSGRVRWRQRVNPPAGNYSLRVVGHDDWVCRITIR
jgi:hypothetical protein